MLFRSLAEYGADLLTPEAEAAVLFEGRHVAEDHALVLEERAAPLDSFDDPGTGPMHQLAEVNENGLSKGFGLGDIDIDAGFEVLGCAHGLLQKALENSVTAIARLEERK